MNEATMVKNEIIMIEGKFIKVKRFKALFWAVILMVVIPACIALICYDKEFGVSYLFELYCNIGLISGVLWAIIWFVTWAVRRETEKMIASLAICVTNKRVWGKFIQGVNAVGVDLPLSAISAVTLVNTDTIGLATSGGQFSIPYLANRDKVYEVIKNLINELATRKEEPEGQNKTVDVVEEIRKFKRLCDEGIITVEEFNEKKRRLMQDN